MKRLKMIVSLKEFMTARDSEVILTYQNPLADGQEGPTPKGSAGWLLCRNRTEQNSGGGTLFPSTGGSEWAEDSFGKAVEAADELGARTVQIEHWELDELSFDSTVSKLNRESIESAMDRLPQVQAFRAAGGRLMSGPDEIKPGMVAKNEDAPAPNEGAGASR
jgi:hypothetical protein